MKQELLKNAQPTAGLLQDIQDSRNLAEALMKTKHYQQLGPDGIFAVIQKAKSLGINPMEALNGGLYYVQGRVEMSAQMMNQLIRSRGHSIRKDPKSTKQLCILHGKRADNGDEDTWLEASQKWLTIHEQLETLGNEEKTLRESLIQMAGAHNAIGGGIRVTRSLRKGNVQYGKIPELQDLDLEQYRKEPSEVWRLTAV